MNKLALVTGSSRGIGRSIAQSLSQKNYDVIVHYNKNKEKANEVKANIERNGCKAHIFQSDVSKNDDLQKLFNYINNEFLSRMIILFRNLENLMV